MAPSFESTNNSQEFPIIDIIITFSRREGLGEVRAQMPIAISIHLKEDGARSMFGSIGGESKGTRGIREL